MDEETAKIAHIIERTPQWVRNDLLSKDAAVRMRAEETLAAMIASAMNGDVSQSTDN